MDLGEGLRKAIAKLRGATIIDLRTIREFDKELQRAMISADVDIALVAAFTKRIEEAATREKLPDGVAPKDYITNMVYEELVKLMGKSYEPDIKPKRVLLAGMYGAGKTTMAGKLAKFYQDRGLGAGLICCDVSRPAAYEQLETLAKQVNVQFFGMRNEKDVRRIVREGLKALKDRKVIICDSSGRSAFDEQLVHELKEIAHEFRPDEKFLVINADTGQVAGKQAAQFNDAIGIDGVIVTKMDGSGRGGGALSAVSAANARVTFIGTGEKMNAVELYNSEKFVGRLLGIPDIESLVRSVNEAIKEAKVNPEEMNVEKLSYDTFYSQLKAMQKMGPMKNMLGMMGMQDVPKNVVEQGEGKLAKYKAIIGSMTLAERREGMLLKEHGRVARIAKGSGTSERDVRMLMSDFNKMKKMYEMFKNDRNVRKNLSKFMKMS
ncbi:MAG: signal recognition particle receptor subunit alpha [Candidatus Marsarchaeota archaeon]|nr:signal recognition particle receptor subunit alpha [Candidatus Marsarchaeota archaeon]